MKAGWQLPRLGDVCRFEKIQDTYSGLPYVGLEHIESDTAQFLGSLDPLEVKSATFRFTNKHVLYGRLRPYLNKVLMPDFTGHCSTEIFPLAPNSELLREFLCYWLLSGETVQRINATCTGARMPRADMNAVLDFIIPLPPLPEQHRIVTILDEAFDAIATAKANTEQNLRNARALFESYLEGVFSQRGDGWVDRRLSEVAKDFGRGKSKHRPRNDPKLYGGPYPFIQTGDVRNSDHLITEYTQTYSEAGLAQSKLWPKGTLCITIAANIAETGILGFDACFPDSVIGLVPNPEMTSTNFLEYLLQSFKAHLQAQGKGSAQDNINLGTFENQYFPFPSLNEQESIVKTMDSLREETQRLESLYQQKLTALDELKKSLLNQAFSGNLPNTNPPPPGDTP
jgi:type I restriction enzyme S subunit